MATLTAPTFTKSGTKATTTTKLDSVIFGFMPENFELIKLAYIAYLANGRENLAQTKTRGLVSGGGKKPWRQKGTGRARFGSTRNPIWRGGGIAFGPTGEENYTKKMHVASKRKALRQSLSLAAKEGRIMVIEEFITKDAKVAKTVKLLNAIGANGSVLLVVDRKDEATDRATSNLTNVKLVLANYLNVFDTVNADVIVIAKPALPAIEAWLGGDK